jgi:DNA repair exonuclease SbcCD nuclease subunit
MPRLLHLADVHLGARHRDLGEAAEAQRRRQLSAFQRAVDVAIERRVDVALIAGDLFDSNAQPRRTVERAAAELRRLADAQIRSVLIPGTHDCYDAASIYRAFDLRALAGLPADSASLTVLCPAPGPTEVSFPDLDLVVYGRVFPAKRAPRSPLAEFTISSGASGWRVGMIHGALRIPGRVEDDDVVFDEAEIAESGLDYLALGHWHSFLEGRAGATTWAYAGAPEPVAVDQDGAGGVLLVTLDDAGGERRVTLERIAVSRTTYRALDLDASTIPSQEALVAMLRAHADPDLMLDVRLVGVRTDTLAVDAAEVSQELAASFLRVRVRDRSTPAPPAGELPPADTILGAFIRDVEERIARSEATGDTADAEDAREVLRLGRLLLDMPRDVTLA